MKDVKFCPFCGSKKIEIEEFEGNSRFMIEQIIDCKNCKITSKIEVDESED